MTSRESTVTLFDKAQFYLIIAFVAVVPLLMRFQIYTLDLQTASVWNGSLKIVDLFSLFKSRVIILIGILTLILLVIRIRGNNFIWNLPIVLLIIYAILVTLSSIFSKYQTVAWFGFVERYEGAFVIISYLLVAIAAAQIFAISPQLVKKLLNAFLWSGVAVAAIGMTQLVGYDFMETSFFKTLVIPPDYKSVKLIFAFSGQGIIYSTLYNPNYVGSYSALYFYIALWSVMDANGLPSIFISFFFTICAMILLAGSMSKSAFFAVSALLVPSLLFTTFIYKKRVFRAAMAIILMLTVMLGINIISDWKIFEAWSSFIPYNLMNRTDNITNIKRNISETPPLPVTSKVIDLSFDKNIFKFTTDVESLTLIMENSELKLFDTNLVQLRDIKSAEKVGTLKGQNVVVYDVTINDERYKRYSLRLLPEKQIALLDTGLFGTLPLKYHNDNFYILYRGKDICNTITRPKVAAIFQGREHLASNRGYIWSRLINKLKNNIFLGDGPDTTPFVFPQTDVIGKMNIFKNPLQIVDKPHNWYIQVAQGSGIVSLIVLLLLFMLLLIHVFFTSVRQNQAIVLTTISLAGYLIAAIFNDSVVSVAPIFWTLLGTVVAGTMDSVV